METKYQKIASYEAKGDKLDKVLLLYSGGLDTSVMLTWIQENYGAELYTLTFNIGQTDDNFDEIKEKALKLGAKGAFVVDAQEEFANKYISKAIKANGNYQHGYHLFCPLGRAIIAKKAVEIAHQEGIDVIAHGATGKGNDQVRFDSYVTILDPDLKILAPVRESALTREEQKEYALKHNIPLQSHSKMYSYDQNLWGISAEGAEIEEIEKEPNTGKILLMNKMIDDTPENTAKLKIGFEEGLPVSLNGEKLPLLDIVKAMATLGAEYGVGTTNFVEDRIVGLKVRGVYEQPAAAILIKAHHELEKLVSTYEENEFKTMVDTKWAELVYRAQWYDPLMKNLNALIDKQNEKVDGEVTIELYKGNVTVTAMKSPHCLLDANLASFDTHQFNQQASASFIEHYSFQQKMAYKIGKNQ